MLTMLTTAILVVHLSSSLRTFFFLSLLGVEVCFSGYFFHFIAKNNINNCSTLLHKLVLLLIRLLLLDIEIASLRFTPQSRVASKEDRQTSEA